MGAVPVAEFLVQGMHLVDIVAGGIVKDHGEADCVGIVDDVARGHGRWAGPEMTDGGDLGQHRPTILQELLPGGVGRAGFQPEIDGVDEHEASPIFGVFSGKTCVLQDSIYQRVATEEKPRKTLLPAAGFSIFCAYKEGESLWPQKFWRKLLLWKNLT